MSERGDRVKYFFTGNPRYTPEYKNYIDEEEKNRNEALKAIEKSRGDIGRKETAMAALARMAKERTQYETPMLQGPTSEKPESPAADVSTLYADAGFPDAEKFDALLTKARQSNSPTVGQPGQLSEGQREALRVTEDVAKRSPSQIYDEQGLTSTYSEVPEVQNYMKNRQEQDQRDRFKQSFEKNIDKKTFDENDMSVLNTLIDADRFDDAIAYMQTIKRNQKKGAGGLGWASTQGSDDPEKVKQAQDAVQKAIESGTINSDFEKAAWTSLAESRPVITIEKLTGLGSGAIKKQIEQPIDVNTAAKKAFATTRAAGLAKPDTPEFIADQSKEWKKTVDNFTEAYQQYSLGKRAPDTSIGDVALINSLEKVREINSAVMYGDYEKWNKAGNVWSKLFEEGVVDASGAITQNRLTPQRRAEIMGLLDDLYSNRKTLINSAIQNKADIAKNDFKWDDERIKRVYYVPKLPEFKKGIVPPGQSKTVPENNPARKPLEPGDYVWDPKTRKPRKIVKQ